MDNSFIEYNNWRHKFFCIYHKHGWKKTEYLVKKYLDEKFKLKSGLLGELNFYHNFKDDFKLTPALDSGDKVDFSGFVNSKPVRIDVTSNIDYKKIEDYSKVMKTHQGFNYKIAIVDKTNNYKLEEIMDITLPVCSKCGNHMLVSANFEEEISEKMNIIMPISNVTERHYCFSCEMEQYSNYFYQIFEKPMTFLISDTYEVYGDNKEDFSIVSKKIKDSFPKNVLKYLREETGIPFFAYTELINGDDSSSYYHIYWKHPFVKSLCKDDFLGFYEGF